MPTRTPHAHGEFTHLDHVTFVDPLIDTDEQHFLGSGDTLFAGSIGRTDLPGGDMRTLQASLKRLLTLPDDTFVFTGHGPPTTIGRERQSNPFLQM
jgi:glyoxylase-like metal-dependent hydrolase (beta-lactamase superfamily II)